MNEQGKLSEKDLLEIINDLQTQLNNKKLGLVWNKDKVLEKIVEKSSKNYPFLSKLSEFEINNSIGKKNLLIEGDNYESLTCLNYTHRNKIEIIYIDPPYNTGKLFTYNDKLVDENDTYKHSKWLSFMEKRLILAKDLLKDTGIIFISISEIELANLKLLCDSIFNSSNYIATITWQSLDTVKNDAIFFSTNTEYILVYAKKKETLTIQGILKGAKQAATYKNPDNDKRGPYLLTPIHAKSGSKEKIFSYTFGNGQIWSPPLGTYPRFSYSTLKSLEEDNRLLLDPKGLNAPQKKTFFSEVSERMPPVTFWNYQNYGSTRQSNAELSNIIGKGKFDNPKPTKLIMTLIDLHPNKNAIVLDFFAGSGTTGHAVLKQNAMDGGNRRYILCTDNENLICTEVTYPRMKKVISGYTYSGISKEVLFEKKLTPKLIIDAKSTLIDQINSIIELNKSEGVKIKTEITDDTFWVSKQSINSETQNGLISDLVYYKTDIYPVSDFEIMSDTERLGISYKANDLIALKEDAFTCIEFNDYFSIFKKDNDEFVAIYFKEDLKSFDKMVESIGKYKAKIYIFSYGRIDKTLYSYLPKNIHIEDIPEPLIQIYKDINRNTRGN